MDMSLQVSGSSSPETCTFKLSIKSYAEERPLEICNYEDVFQLKVKETVFHVHRQVLEAASGYFKGLCNSKNTTEGRNQEVKLNDVDVEVLKTLIHFMYTGNVKITEENVWGLLQWSDYFGIDGMKNNVVDFITNNITCENVTLFREQGVHYAVGLVTACDRFIGRNFSDPVFQSLSYDRVKEVLDIKLNSESEIEDCTAAIETWVNFCWETRKTYIPELIKFLTDNAFGAENLKYNTEEGRLKIEFKNVGDSRVTRVTKTLCGEPLPEWSNIEESQR
uniref:kelch-like protein 40b isoform X1 n=1 Tax=Ciona intestinalis TaxID=7719 RepID=UPI000521618C|nr:kelch-like protein 40b isoform X1 [Ciona intestinalis]|eukprot:XP_026689401.1 kelch-like protein 40b isoform X1 [Ciona intestinalis]